MTFTLFNFQYVFDFNSYQIFFLVILGEEDIGDKEQPFCELVEDVDPLVLDKKCPQQLESTKLDDIVIWVDPLDGTSEFAQVGLQFFVVGYGCFR